MTNRVDRSDNVLLRLDRGSIKGHATKTSEGYVRAEAVVSRTGVFLYRNADGTVRRELRHPDDVFARASLDTLKMIPITNGHPAKFVDASNAKELQVGFVGDKIHLDGKYLLAPLVVTDAATVADIEAGKCELSLGYTVELVKEDGTYMGETFEFRQTDIRYNHLAIVEKARAGAVARLNLDEDDDEWREREIARARIDHAKSEALEAIQNMYLAGNRI